MSVNYKTKKSIISILTVICFVFSTVLVCYADNIKVNGDNEKKDYSLFSNSGYFICLPTDKIGEVGSNKDYILSDSTKKITVMDLARVRMCKMCCAIPQGTAYASCEIVANTYKKDGKK